jgi:hypothetical protein
MEAPLADGAHISANTANTIAVSIVITDAEAV